MKNQSCQGMPVELNRCQYVEYTIDLIVSGNVLPDTLLAVFKEAWGEYMLHIIDSKGKDSPEWIHAVSLFKRLVWSLEPDKDLIDRQALLCEIHELIAGLKQGLTAINFEPNKIVMLLTQLRERHLEILGVKQASAKVNKADEQDQSLPEQPPLVKTKKEIIEAHEKKDLVDSNVQAKNQEFLNHGEKEIPDSIKMLKVGTWVEFCSGEGRLKCKLSEKNDLSGRTIFVNRHGAKIAEKSYSELEGGLGNGEVKVLDDVFLFDQALASVIGNSRESKRH